jgi:hypothetical protein
MKEKILKVMHGPSQLEPIYQLEHSFKLLARDSERAEFVEALKDISITGTTRERFAAFTVIEIIGKAEECSDEIKYSVDNINVQQDSLLVRPLLGLCATISQKWSIDFIKKVILTFGNARDSYLYDLAIRCYISTVNWSDLIEEIINSLRTKDDVYFVDMVAYFRWKRTEKDLEELIGCFNGELSKKFQKLRFKIEDRYNNHYMAVPNRKG